MQVRSACLKKKPSEIERVLSYGLTAIGSEDAMYRNILQEQMAIAIANGIPEKARYREGG